MLNKIGFELYLNYTMNLYFNIEAKPTPKKISVGSAVYVSLLKFNLSVDDCLIEQFSVVLGHLGIGVSKNL